MTTNELVAYAVTAMEDKKGTEISVIDISKVSVVADYFMLVSGRRRQLPMKSRKSLQSTRYFRARKKDMPAVPGFFSITRMS